MKPGPSVDALLVSLACLWALTCLTLGIGAVVFDWPTGYIAAGLIVAPIAVALSLALLALVAGFLYFPAQIIRAGIAALREHKCG